MFPFEPDSNNRLDYVYNGPPLPTLSPLCKESVEGLINGINRHLNYLAFQLQRFWPNQFGAEHDRIFQIIHGTCIDQVIWNVADGLKTLSVQDIALVVEYIYQRCNQHLRKVYFLEYLLASCYDRMECMRLSPPQTTRTPISMLSPPITPHVDNRDQPLVPHTLGIPYVPRTFNWHTPERVSSPSATSLTPSASPLIQNIQPATPQNAVASDPILTRIKIEPNDDYIVPSPQQNTFAVNSLAPSVKIEPPAQQSARINDPIKAEIKIESDERGCCIAPPTIEKVSANVCGTSSAELKTEIKVPYDMPDWFSSNDLADEQATPPPQQRIVDEHERIEVPDDRKKHLFRDHFLRKQFEANNVRWPYKSIDQFVNAPRPKSLKNRERTARGLVDV